MFKNFRRNSQKKHVEDFLFEDWKIGKLFKNKRKEGKQ